MLRALLIVAVTRCFGPRCPQNRFRSEAGSNCSRTRISSGNSPGTPNCTCISRSRRSLPRDRRTVEGNTSAYYTIFQDGKKYRMYYRGSHWDTTTKKAAHREVTCYAESTDGIHWKKPNLGLFAFNGSKKNNIVWDGIGTHCFTPFKDTNPDCSADARYKALSRGRPRAKKGLYAFHSADGIHWTLTRKTPVITVGAFDSQNLAYWDPNRKLYVAYYRQFRNGIARHYDLHVERLPQLDEASIPEDRRRAAPTPLHQRHATVSRAPHLTIAFPTRYIPKGSRVEPTFMVSRDGFISSAGSNP